MDPRTFIAKWQGNPLSEKAGAQSFFLDLCDLLGVDKPTDPGSYCFERGATRSGAGRGWADVWKRGCFAWESKAPGKDLGVALKQLMTYALALDNPPLLVVSDREIIQIHTHFTGTPSQVHTIALEDIGLPENLDKLRRLFDDPDWFRPARTTFAVTEDAAKRMGDIAERLTKHGNDPQETAHFLIQCVFCMFAEDARLLPEKLFETVLDRSNPDGAKAQSRLAELFKTMQAGGDFALHDIPWFNGGLFAAIAVPALTTPDVVELLAAARMDWRAIEPAILGTLFERGLNPDMRSQLGAHYTDLATIMKLVRPVVAEPLEREWAETRIKLEALAPKFGYQKKKVKGIYPPNTERREGQALLNAYLEKLRTYRVLDPACGSGNFLYLSLKALKDQEHKANLEAEELGLQRDVTIHACPANVLGIELNPYAAELARVTVWIGEIQWMLDHGYAIRRNPILAPLDHIECRDAILSPPSPASGGGVGGEGQSLSSEPDWPPVDAIVGNPPFLGDKKMRGELGGAYTDTLRKLYEGRVPGGADLVTYWFEKARAHIEAGQAQRAGLVATNSIRGGANRKVLERIVAGMPIFDAWSDEPWINNGAAVRVSLVCFGKPPSPALPRTPPPHAGEGLGEITLNGQTVAVIHTDLTAGTATDAVDLTRAQGLPENYNIAFQGVKFGGPFEIKDETARQLLSIGGNPNGRPNSDVVRRWFTGLDITRRPEVRWCVDFAERAEIDASMYEGPFELLSQQWAAENERRRVAEKRELRAGEEATRVRWWMHQRARPEMDAALAKYERFIATAEVSKHRLFVWMEGGTKASGSVYSIARSDDATFGILHSRFHELWSLGLCTWLGVGNDPRYTPTTTFETFPFPAGLTPQDTAAPAARSSPTCLANSVAAQNIAAAARRLDELRNAWLNPPEWVDWVRTPEEEKAGFPARPVAKPGHEAALKKRTLTNLYNQRAEGKVSWLDHAHQALDAAVAAAYGWADYMPDMPDEEILRRLLALNLERARAH